MADYNKLSETFGSIGDVGATEYFRGPILTLLDKIPFLDDNEVLKNTIAGTFWTTVGITIVTVIISTVLFIFLVNKFFDQFRRFGDNAMLQAILVFASLGIELVSWIFSFTGVAAVIGQIIQILIDMFALFSDFAATNTSFLDIMLGVGGLVPLFGMFGNLAKGANKLRKASKTAKIAKAAKVTTRTADVAVDVAKISKKRRALEALRKGGGKVFEDVKKGEKESKILSLAQKIKDDPKVKKAVEQLLASEQQ